MADVVIQRLWLTAIGEKIMRIIEPFFCSRGFTLYNSRCREGGGNGSRYCGGQPL